MIENNVFSPQEEEDFNISSFLFGYLKNWYWFILTLSLGYTGAYLYLKQFTPIYRVNATVLIKDDKFKSKSDGLVEALSMPGSKLMDNEIEIFKSRLFMGRVIDALDLRVSYWQEKKFRDVELFTNSPIKVIIDELNNNSYNNSFYIKYLSEDKYILLDNEQKTVGVFGYNQLLRSQYGKFRVFRNKEIKSGKLPTKIVFSSREGLISSLLNAVQVKPLNNNSSFISLSIDIALPNKGKAILSKVLGEYERTSLEDKNRESANTLKFIEERLKLVEDELGDVEDHVEQYRRKEGISELSTDSNLFLSKVGENDAKLNELDIQSKVLNEVDRYLNNSAANEIAPATIVLNDPILSAYIIQYAQLESDRSKLSRSVQAENPVLLKVNAQMRNITQAIKENLNNQKQNISLKRAKLVNSNNLIQGSISSIPRKERELIGIKRQASIKESLYLQLLQKREETALSYASTVTDSRIIDEPYSTGGIIRPDKKNIYQIALLIGLIIPIILITLKSFLINTIQSMKELERKTGLKVFGEIGFNINDAGDGLIDINNHSFIGEQLRMIRSNLQYLSNQNNNNKASTFLFTSISSGDGKSFMTTNLALSLALLDKKVLIVQLDLRKPKNLNDLMIDNGLNYFENKGISMFLIGKANPNEIVIKTKFKNLYIIPSGPIPPNPSELISSSKMNELFEVLKPDFDYILIDTPPLGVVTDATLLISVTDACFFVVRHEKTHTSVIPFISDLKNKKVYKSLNLIFNGVNYKNSTGYEYRGYGYYGKEKKNYKWLNSLFSKKYK